VKKSNNSIPVADLMAKGKVEVIVVLKIKWPTSSYFEWHSTVRTPRKNRGKI